MGTSSRTHTNTTTRTHCQRMMQINALYIHILCFIFNSTRNPRDKHKTHSTHTQRKNVCMVFYNIFAQNVWQPEKVLCTYICSPLLFEIAFYCKDKIAQLRLFRGIRGRAVGFTAQLVLRDFVFVWCCGHIIWCLISFQCIHGAGRKKIEIRVRIDERQMWMIAIQIVCEKCVNCHKWVAVIRVKKIRYTLHVFTFLFLAIAISYQGQRFSYLHIFETNYSAKPKATCFCVAQLFLVEPLICYPKLYP